MEERIRWYPRRSGPRTGARWPRVASGRPVSPSHSPARSAPKREVPPLRSGAPRHAPVGQFGAHAAPVKEAPSSAWTQMPRVLNSPSTAAPTAMWAARLETWWSARTLTRIAPEVDHGVERLQRPALPLQDGVAHRVGDLRGPSPLRGRTDRGRQVVADIAHRHARAYKLMIIESRPSSRRCPLRTKRGVNEPARHRGGPPVSKGPTSESTVLAALPLPRVGTRRRSRLAPLVAQVIGQLSGQPAFQGHSLSKAGSRPSVPVITGPARIDPLEQAVQRPTGTQLLHHTRARQHEPSHHQSSRIDPFKSRGYTDN